MLVPLGYNLRSIFVRRASSLLTISGIAASVAVVAGVLALQQGFARLYSESGREDVAILIRPGATYEGYSMFPRERALELMKSIPEIAQNEDGEPLAAMECFSAVRLFKLDGGETNVPIRGVPLKTYEIRADDLELVEGRLPLPGSDEVIVGRRVSDRVPGCRVGDVIPVNVTPFRVVGVFACEGPHESEIWGDLDRMLETLERFGPSRIVAALDPAADLEALKARVANRKVAPAKLMTEREYLGAQTEVLSFMLRTLARVLGFIVGIAAVFTATNTMLSAVARRTPEIGILLSMGFRPLPIFLSFLFEALLLGLAGGLAGALLVLPINGIKTGTTNFQTFTEVAFAFRITPSVLATAVGFALVLGLIGGAWPAWRASRLRPTEALRRH